MFGGQQVSLCWRCVGDSRWDLVEDVWGTAGETVFGGVWGESM